MGPARADATEAHGVMVRGSRSREALVGNRERRSASDKNEAIAPIVISTQTQSSPTWSPELVSWPEAGMESATS